MAVPACDGNREKDSVSLGLLQDGVSVEGIGVYR